MIIHVMLILNELLLLENAVGKEYHTSGEVNYELWVVM